MKREKEDAWPRLDDICWIRMVLVGHNGTGHLFNDQLLLDGAEEA